MTNSIDLIHIYFGSLPIGSVFLHKQEFYIKIDEEEVFSFNDNRKWIFEIHYGCFITKKDFDRYKLSNNDIIKKIK